jgi:hypothetical protein
MIDEHATLGGMRQVAPTQSGHFMINGGVFGGEFLPAEYGIDVGKLRHRRSVSL